MGDVSPPRPTEPILHVDMDAFYASVEVQKDPSLAGRPVLVGGRGGRGVVASASYEARAFGIHSAMPMARARRLCPQAVVCPPDFDAYRRVSGALLDLFRSLTPLVEPLSLDEAFLDVGGATRLFGQPGEVGALIRRRIRDDLGLVASVGVAPNKYLAKLCSGKAKPDGLLHLPASDVEGFLAPLGVRDLWGVGEQTAARLDRFGIRTLGDVRMTPATTLDRILGPAAATQIAGLARGEDERRVVPYEPAKGMSAEETFDRDIDDPAVLRRELLRLADGVARRLRRGDVAARTVTLKLRYANFVTITRSRTLGTPTDQGTVLHRESCAMLDALRLERVRVRLIGLGTSNLVPSGTARQMDLLGDDRWALLDRAADAARSRFGDTAVTRGALLGDRSGSGAGDGPRDGGAGDGRAFDQGSARAEDWRGLRPGGDQ
jgi:DNA polymerase IV